jgi:hypothetical protein
MNPFSGGNMKAEDVNWKGYEVHTGETNWVCIESKATPILATPDRIDYLMTFEARDPRTEGTPATRSLHLRTSSFKVSEEPGFLGFLQLVVQGMLIDTTPGDRFKEVYARD